MSTAPGADPAATALQLDQLAAQIAADLGPALDEALMIGIHSGGLDVARALHRRLALHAPLGSLSIRFYRDDFSRIGLHPSMGATDLPLAVEDRLLVLVDDVLYSGRTVRAALNELFDYGRPARVYLAVLVERSGHELPIRADAAAARLALGPDQQVQLHRDPLQWRVEAVAR